MSVYVDSRGKPWLLAALYLEFALTGVATTLLGPLLPLFIQRCLMSDTKAGALVATQFAGGLVGSLFANRNLRTSLIVGMPLIGIGVGALGFSSCRLSYLCTTCYGIGLGLTMPAINLTVARWHSEKRASSLTLLNFLWGVGALASPVVVEWARRQQLLSWSLLGLGGVSLLLWLSVIRAGFPPVPVHETRAAGNWYANSLLFFAVLFFLYVGVETSFGDWSAVYATRMPQGNNSIALWAVACFWLALLSGRLLNAILLWRTKESLIYWPSMAITLGGILLYFVSGSSIQVVLAASVTGLGLAPIYPLLLSFASESLLARRNSGWVFASASLGGASLPWLTGRASAGFGSLRLAFIVPASAVLLIVVLSLARLARSVSALSRVGLGQATRSATQPWDQP